VAFNLQSLLEALAAVHCPADRRHYHAALYDALAGTLLLARLAKEPTVGEQSLSWLLRMSTLDRSQRDAFVQGELF
ncbi:MAG TPA: 3'-5' exonuclease, partial [Candidatus Synoicihabitans sp.]|nr:3'-5' exonuclease [Candidatus Synoicihabitans sp.]